MSLEWDQSRFNAALDSYVKATRKDVVTVLNSKGYFIARKALWFTDAADQKNVRQLKDLATSRRIREPKDKGLVAGAMMSKRYGKGDGLYGSRMKSAINSMLASRVRARSFLKSGWLTAIRGLDPKAEDKNLAAPAVGGVKQFGQAKGAFSSASDVELKASITNSAQAKSDTVGALQKFGMPALMKAFDNEASSMEEYVIKKNAKSAAAAQAAL